MQSGSITASPCGFATSRTMSNSKKDDVILVVEDNLDIAGLVAKYLANAGYEVVVIRDGADALEAFRQHRPFAGHPGHYAARN